MLLETTVKTDGSPFSFSLGRLTLIVGPNGGGKTAIRQSLELALDGAVSGHLGRTTVKLAALLGELFPHGAERQVTLTGDDQQTLATWLQSRDGEKFAAPSRTGATFRFPVREVEEALAGDLTRANSSARRTFAAWACRDFHENIVVAAAEARLAKADAARFADIWTAKKEAPVARLLSVLDYVSSRARDLAGEVKGARAVADAARETAASPATTQAVPALDYPYDYALVLLDRGMADPVDCFCPVCGSGSAQEVGHRHLESVVAWAEAGLRAAGMDPGSPGNRPPASHGPAAHPPAADASAVRRANETVAWLEDEKRVYDTLAAKIHAAVEELLNRGIDAFESEVDRFLPAGWRVGIDLADGFRLGLRRGGAIHAGLSGIEFEIVKCAIAAAISGSDANVMLIPGDRAWDARTLGAFLDAMRSSPFAGHVLVETTIHPDSLPAGWTVIDLYEGAGAGISPALDGPAAGEPPSNGPATPASPAQPAPPAQPAIDPIPAKAWSVQRLREYARSEGRRNLKHLHRQLTGGAAKAAWGDEETITSIATHLGRTRPSGEPPKPEPAAQPPVAQPAKPAKPPGAPPPPGIGVAQRRILTALGYSPADIDRMLPAEALRILVNGLVADEHEVAPDGHVVGKPGAQA